MLIVLYSKKHENARPSSEYITCPLSNYACSSLLVDALPIQFRVLLSVHSNDDTFLIQKRDFNNLSHVEVMGVAYECSIIFRLMHFIPASDTCDAPQSS